MHTEGVEFKAVSITSWQRLTRHFMMPARHTNLFLIIISIISSMLHEDPSLHTGLRLPLRTFV